MKLSFLILLCIGALAAARASTAADPFGGSAPSWTDSVQAAKPLRLEICFGEISLPKPAKETLSDDAVLNAVTSEFLAACKTLRIAVAPDDEGRVEAPGQLTAIYRLKTKEQSHALDLNFSLADEGRREINTSITITDQWIVLGGLTRTQVTTTFFGKTKETRKNLIIAFRLVPAKP